jgi:hypothetical protein
MSRNVILSLIALGAIAACSGPAAIPSATQPSAAAAPAAAQPSSSAALTPAASPTLAAPTPASRVDFTSPLYDYSIVVPAGWATVAAMLPWDGTSAPGSEDATVDQFVGPSDVSSWAYAGPMTGDLAGFVKDNIAWTVRDHGDTCPATAPETTEPIEIGGESGMLLSWDCGILINQAVLVRDGTNFVFAMRDPGIHAATDPADRAILEDLLGSVTFPT